MTDLPTANFLQAVKPLGPALQTPEDRLAAARQQLQQPDIEPIIDDDGIEEPGFFEMVGLSFKQESITGTLVTDTLPFLIAGEQISQEEDPDFKPYDRLTPEFLRKHPYMIDSFANGEVLSLPNDRALDFFIERKRERFEDAQRLAQADLGIGRIGATAIGQIPDFVTGGLLLKGLGAGANATRVAQLQSLVARSSRLLRSTAISARAGRVAAAGGANMFQELGLQWADPNREVALDEEVAAAAGFGLAFGGAFEGLGAGFRATGGRMFRRKLEKTITRMREDFEIDDIGNLDDVIANQNTKLQQILDEPVDGPRQINVIDTPESRPLIDQLRQKYDDAGEELVVAPHQADDFVRWARALETVDKSLTGDLPALGKLVAEGRVNQATAAAIDRVRSVLDVVTPGGRLRRGAASNLARRAHRVFFDEASATVESVDDPLLNTPITSAEAIKTILNTRRAQAIQDIADEYRAWMKSPGNERIDYVNAMGETLKIRKRVLLSDRNNFNRAVADYMRRRVDADRLGQEVDAPEPIRKAGDRAFKTFDEYGKDIEGVGLIDDLMLDERRYLPRRWLVWKIEQDRPRFTGKLKQQFQKYNDRHFDTGELKAAEEREVIDAVLRRLDDPDGRIKAIRREARDDVDQPTGESPLQAEAMNVGVGDKETFLPDLPRELRDRELFSFGPGDIRLRKGERVQIRGRSRRFLPQDIIRSLTLIPRSANEVIDLVRRKTDEVFSVRGSQRDGVLVPTAALDDLRGRGINIDQAIEAARIARDEQLAANPVVGRATRENLLDDLRARYGMELDEDELIATAKASDDPNDFIVADALQRLDIDGNDTVRVVRADKMDPGDELVVGNRVWKVKKAADDPFEPDLTVLKSRGKRIPVDENTQVPIEKFRRGGRPALSEADLPDDIRSRYRQALDEWFGERARKATDNLTGLNMAHGVQDSGTKGAPLARRRLEQIDETEFAEFLDDNIEDLLVNYDHHVSGRIAARRAIQRDADYWRPVVKEVLDEDLTFDPAQIQRVLDRHNADLIDAAGELDRLRGTKLQDKMMASAKNTKKIIDRNLERLQGIPPIGHDPAAEVGFSHFFQRNFLRLPGMAFLGKVSVSSVPDVANLMMYAQMNPRNIKTIAGGFFEFGKGISQRRVSNDGLEGLMIAIDDEGLGRSLQLMETAHLPYNPNFGRGAKGRGLQVADSAIEQANRAFFKYSGMNRWNAVWKRVAARVVMQVMFDGAHRMVRAGRLIREGVDEGEAFRRAGLKKADRVRLQRLGLNAERSQAMLDQFRRHGVDGRDGSPLADLTDEQFAGFRKSVHPNLKDWDDPDLIETFTAAVNSEVDNLIVTPKLTSRPLFQTDPRWGFLGRAINQFQAFAFSYGNQLAPILAQQPSMALSRFMFSTIALGAVSDALHNQLSGRRTIEQTAQLWLDKPMGMTYAAANRSGLTGWLARPLAIMDTTNYGPGPLMGNDVSSMAAAQTLSVRGQLGPFFDWADLITEGALMPLLTDAEFDARRKHTLRKAIPFQNYLWFSGLYQLTRELGIENPAGEGRGVDVFLTRPPVELRRRPRDPEP